MGGRGGAPLTTGSPPTLSDEKSVGVSNRADGVGLGAPTSPPPRRAGGGGRGHANLTTVSRQALPDEIPVVFTIGPDGSVSGAVGNAALTNGQLAANRSWFGRLMNWRTDYVIRGTLSRVVESY